MFDKFTKIDSKKSPSEIHQMLNDSDKNSMDVEEDTKNFKSMENTSQQKDYTNIDQLREIIYKTYSKSLDVSKILQKKEKKRMKKIMNLLIYIQMRKIEMKLNFFNDFEKLTQFEIQQIKSMESQIIQDRIKLAIKKSEIIGLSNKMKEYVKIQNEMVNNHELTNQHENKNGNELMNCNPEELIDKANSLTVDNEMRILDLN
jgi:SWI/SNF related-matrix-associated actin-dependent regulator of chromatin subfamily C